VKETLDGCIAPNIGTAASPTLSGSIAAESSGLLAAAATLIAADKLGESRFCIYQSGNVVSGNRA
jgi:hypothetical protein